MNDPITTDDLKLIHGDQFDAVRLQPEGWVVLSPWVTTPEGHPFRLHITTSPPGHSEDARAWCEHIARQLNDGRAE